MRLDDNCYPQKKHRGFDWTYRDEVNDLLDILENYGFQYPGPGEIVLKLKALVEKLD